MFTEDKAEKMLEALEALCFEFGLPYSGYGKYRMEFLVQDNKIINVEIDKYSVRAKPKKKP
jgi:hypothetical protein